MSRQSEISVGPYSASVHDVSLWPSAASWLLVSVLALGAWLAVAFFQPAHAGGVNWSVGVTFPGAVVYPAQPVYQTYPSAPVYQTYPVAPVVYPSRPAVQVYPVMPAPQPVYGYGGYNGYGGHHPHRRHHHWQHDRHDGRGHGSHHDRGYQRGWDR